MEEMLEKIKSEINAIKEEQEKLEELTQNSKNLRLEQEKLEKERDTISDTKSGFYQDLKEKAEEKKHEFIEADNKRRNKDKEVTTLIFNKKEEIRNQIASKKQFIDENRNVDVEELKSIDLEKLKKEKEKLEREIALNDITKEEFETKSDEEKKEIRKAKERYLINKNRLNEINPTLELIEALNGKIPKEKFIELDNLDKIVEKNFNKDNLDNVLKEVNSKEQEKADKQKMLAEMIAGREKREEERYFEDIKSGLRETNKRIRQEQKEEQEEWPDYKEPTTQEKIEKIQKEFEDYSKDYSKVHLKAGKEVEQVHIEVPNRVKRIVISEKLGRIAWSDNHMNEKGDSTIRAFEEKKAKFKRLDIYENCKEIAGNPLKGVFLQRKINPEIVLALDGYGEQLEEYISSVYNKTELPFELVHDLSEVGILTKIQRNVFARVEKKLGATVLGKLFSKNEALKEPEEVEESGNTEKEPKPIDEYRNVIDQKTQAKNTEKILKEQEEKMAKDVQDIKEEKMEKVSGDAVLDENDKEIAQL